VGRTLLSAEELGVKPGDVISYYARARDVGRGKRSTLTTSDIFFLEVKPFNEEFVSAQSQAGGQGGTQIDGLVEAQKQIIASTWNIERRSAGGRSAEDIRAIAEAQTALKARAQQMASRGRRRFGSMPQRAAAQGRQPVPLSDPIAAAILAMDKAVEQLQTDRTKDALPHEMAALNGLLQAQAEVRRREVARQQANGSGNSGNRAGQDMSALFDKELQRQQQTNYETQPSVESRADRPEPDQAVLDRIRDLARRQEDLSRRQSELGQSPPDADEMRRRLEKLSREQTQLREEAEELSTRLGSQGSGAAQSGRRSQTGTTGGRSADGASGAEGQSLRDAVEEMRAAANDLNRNDARTAARSGSRAAEQLRRLESQTESGAAGSSERARSDLQMEGQQIAQEQRRIAAEAERLDRGPDGAARTDARTRLADEKERLAERIDALQRAVGRSGTGSKAQSDSLARELGAVGQRMRASAQEMRDRPAGQSGSGKGEQELARSLERIAGQLDTGVPAESRQLSAQLAEMRAIRDRLQRLEEQMRTAASGAGAPPAANQQSVGRGGQQGDNNGEGGRGGGAQTNETQRLQEEYGRELERSRQALERLSTGQQAGGSNGGTPATEQFSRSAPGTEAFKQDRSAWESLRKALDLALEQHEAAVSSRLTRKAAEDRFNAGGSERVPEGYRPLIARYFESLASGNKARKP
jgi:hypothetical protein